MGPYYVNYGRWCSTITGPFDTEELARAYAALAETSPKPAVVTVGAPDTGRLTRAKAAITHAYIVTLCRSNNTHETIRVVAEASTGSRAGNVASAQLGSGWRYVCAERQ